MRNSLFYPFKYKSIFSDVSLKFLNPSGLDFIYTLHGYFIIAKPRNLAISQQRPRIIPFPTGLKLPLTTTSESEYLFLGPNTSPER